MLSLTSPRHTSTLPSFPAVRLLATNVSFGSRSCENMISDAGVARQRWLAPASARGQAAIRLHQRVDASLVRAVTPASPL